MMSLSSAPSTSTVLARDWAIPRSAAAFTGYVSSPDNRGPGGALLLCVANTPIPCKLEHKGSQRAIQFTVLNVRECGWIFAPW